jgi:hypothetical protein
MRLGENRRNSPSDIMGRDALLPVEIAYNQPEFDYRRAEGVNQSSLKKILESPAHYQAALKFRLIPTPAMEMGTALHALCLDGEEAFNGTYIKKPEDIKLNTKEGKEWKASVGRKKVLTTGGKDDPWNSVQGMARSLRHLAWFDPSQEDYIKYNEVSVYWEDRNVKCKARLDRVMVEEGLVLDLKTTDSVEPELFTKKVVGLGYDFQAAAYSIAAEAAFGKPFKFIFACVERKAPYTVSLFEVSDEMMEEGKRKFERAIRIYNECQASGEWPNKPAMINKLTYPSWYQFMDQEEEFDDLF